jgi:hypothetical protein
LNRRLSQSEDGEPWFANSSSVDLAQKYFGSDPNFKTLWEKYQGEKAKYLIYWKLSDKCKSAFSTEKAEWTDVEMIAKMREKAVKDFDEAIASSEQNRQNLQKELNENLLLDLQKIHATTNSMRKVLRAYQDESAKISTLNAEAKKLEKEKPKKWKATKKKKETEIRECRNRQADMLAEGSDKPTGKSLNGNKVYASLADLEFKIKSKEWSVDSKQKEVEDKKKQIEKAETMVESIKQKKQAFIEKFKDNIHKVLFRLRVEGETIKE